MPFVFLILSTLYLLIQYLAHPYFSLSTIKPIFNVWALIFPSFLIVCGIAVWFRARFKKEKRFTRIAFLWIAAGIGILAFRLYVTHIEPYRLKVREITIVSPKVNQSLRILHISDIQSHSVGWFEASVFKKIREIQPDLILDTGDLLQPVPPATWDSEIVRIRDLFDTLTPPLGIFSVVGNHDEYTDEQLATGIGPMKILNDRERILEWGTRRIRLYGLSLDQSDKITQKEPVEKWLRAAKPDELTILMGHIPDYILDIQDLPIDLCLAGHIHGGQVNIPFLGPLIVISEIPRRWALGFHAIGNTHLNVSAGIGYILSIPPIRFLCPPEITLFHIVPQPVSK